MFGREINEHKKIPSIRYNNLTKDECDALYNLKNDSSIIIKGADKSYVVVVQDREDYLKEAYKPLDDREVYEEDPNDPNALINTITGPNLMIDMAPASSKEFLDIQATVECGFTLKLVRDMIKTYNQMHRTDKYSQHSSIIWPVWLNGSVFVYELSGCWFESRCSHLIFRYGACFEHGVP